MSGLRSSLWLVLGVCAFACASEQRDFGSADAAVSADTDEDTPRVDDEGPADGGATETDEPTTAETNETSNPDPGKDDDTQPGDDDDDDDVTEDESSDPGPDDGATTDEPSDDDTEPPADTDGTSETDEPGASDGGTGPGAECSSDANCDDLNPCNGVEACIGGECTEGQWQDDGSACELGTDAAKRVCSDGNCVQSICGDGYTDERTGEACDDGNANNADGCTVGCEYSCSEHAECDDGLLCNGSEQCDDALHACVPGANLDDQTECGNGVICHAGSCVPVGCGNAEHEENEECDDGNDADGDGCDTDCTFTCTEDAQCDDESVCTGTETCSPDTHTCVQGEAVACASPDSCTTAECDPIGGCYYPLIDGDGDGFASDAYDCGSDCDDGDATVYSGAAELCDGKDNNCNGEKDETAPNWYPDCDWDGYAPAEAAAVQQCEMPPSGPEECVQRGLVGTWTAVTPASGNEDCWDDNASVHPMDATQNDSAWSQYSIAGRPVSVDYDYNCDGVEEPTPAETYVAEDAYCSELIIFYPVFAAQQASELDPAVIALPEPVACIGTDGWMGDAPACGDPGAWTYCSGWTGSCVRYTDSSHYQSCR